MKRRNERSRMGVSIVASLLIHAAAILLIPVALPGTAVIYPIYPIEFGEIAQTLETPREGSPEGNVSSAPEPKARASQAKGSQTGPETSVTVKPATASKDQPKPAPKPAPRPEPEPAPKPAPKQQPKPEPEPVPAPKTAGEQAKPEPKPKPQGQPPTPRPGPQSGPKETPPGPATGSTGPASSVQAEEKVLTAKSNETAPVPSSGNRLAASEPAAAAGSSPGTGEAQPGPASGRSQESREALSGAGEARTPTSIGAGVGHEPAGPSGPGTSEPAKPVVPPKPRGEEFGTGQSLVLSGVPPVYPKNPLNEGVEGVVGLAVTVDSAGNVSEALIVSGSGDSRLDEQAMRAVLRGWRFQAIGWPYRLSVRIAFRKKSVEVTFWGVTVLGD
ncbi:MAG: TonB family protein [Bacillota bacterium]